MLFEKWEWALIVVLLGICAGAFWYSGAYDGDAEETPATTQINNATVVNNYYCNITEPINGTITVYDSQTESVLITETQTPSPTPTLWNDTRRESVGLPADGYGNPCCKHCTPTPTATPVPEFPCPLRSGC